MINCLSSGGMCCLYFRDQLVTTKIVCSESGIDSNLEISDFFLPKRRFIVTLAGGQWTRVVQ